MKAYPSFGISGHFVWTPNHSTFDHFGADVVSLEKLASLRTKKKRDDAGWSSCCACVFPCLLASWQRRGGQFDLSDRVATCRQYDDYGWESLFKKVRFWVQITFFLFHMGFRRFLQTNFLYIHGWLTNETSKLLCSGCISPWEQHQERAQAPQAQNAWCMRQLMYIENCMGKSPIVKKNV